MGLNVDLSKLRNMVSEEVEDMENRGNRDDSPYKLFYPGENGSVRVKLLFNLPSQVVQRKIIRHDPGKGSKIPCGDMFGEKCEICSKIKDIENSLGKDCGVFRKYGFKTRGICYAQIMDLDKNYMKRDGHPEVGDIVVLMYPISLYNKLAKLMNEAGDHLEDLVCKNVGKTVTITRSQVGGGAPQYDAAIYPYGDEASYKDGSDPENPQATGDELFENMMNSLPDLMDTLLPKYPDERIRTATAALVETIESEYMSGAIMNPGDEPKETKQTSEPAAPASKVSSEPVAQPESAPAPSVETSGRPECYGQHKDGDKKCMLCMEEASCYSDSM